MNHRTPAEGSYPSAVGRYLLHQPIARGGMATVHAARLIAAEGVTRLVAAKRLHPQFMDDPEFVAMFHDEARIASRIHHPNVVPVLDVIHDGDEVILVQEYVHGVPLSYLLKLALSERRPIPLGIALTIISGVLEGLHAAHEATDDAGEPLGIVHRDVSPQNVLVSVDGIPRLVDFGIAKARTSMHHTREGFFKGKLSYMAPEQLRGEAVTRAADIYAAGVMLWELVVNQRFYGGQNDADFVRAVALGATRTATEALGIAHGPISAERWAQVYLLEPIINRAMAAAPEARFATAAEMAVALAEIARNAPTSEVAAWVRAAGADYIDQRQKILLSNEDDRARTSGAYLRVDAPTLDAHPNPKSLPPTRNATKPPPARRWSLHSYERGRTLLPWGLCAVLLVAVCILGGMAIRRERQAEPRIATIIRHVDPGPTSVVIEAEAVPVPAPQPPVFVEPSLASAQPPVRTAAPVARFVPQPRSTPAAPVRGPATCNPPFFFEGGRKIYKPGCL